MQEDDFDVVTPRLRETDSGMEPRPFVVGFSSGYLQRVMPTLPKQGDREPWLNPQDYLGDRKRFLEDTLDDGTLVFEHKDVSAYDESAVRAEFAAPRAGTPAAG